MKLREHSDITPGALVDRNDGLDAELEAGAVPDQAGVYCAGGPAAVAIKRALEGEFHEWDETPEERAEPDIAHILLQVRKAIFERKAPLQHVGVPLAVEADAAGIWVDHRARRTGAQRQGAADSAGEGDRLEPW